MNFDRRSMIKATAMTVASTCAMPRAIAGPQGASLFSLGAANNAAGQELSVAINPNLKSPLITLKVFGWFILTTGEVGREHLLLRINNFTSLYSGSFSRAGTQPISLTDGAGWGICPNNSQRNSGSLDATIQISAVPLSEPAATFRAHIVTSGSIYDQKADTSSDYRGSSTHLLATRNDEFQRPVLTSVSVFFRGGLMQGSLRVYQVD